MSSLESSDVERERLLGWFRDSCSTLHERYGHLEQGRVADYIPELTRGDPDRFAVEAMTVDGRGTRVGDADELFTVQSISKLVVYGLALERHGRDAVLARVGVAPTGERFNSVELDEDRPAAPNPMVNAGAIAVTDLIDAGSGSGSRSDSGSGRLGSILDGFARFLGRRPVIDEAVWASERATGNRNRAIAYLLLSRGIVTDRVEETLDLYFAQCSVLVNVHDLALIGATLANRGVHPVSGEQVLPAELTRDLLTVALTCGMYDYAGEWAYSVGIPAKSGVSGGILGIVPGAGGIATFSPRLDEYGNSVRGLAVFEELSAEFGMHLFDPDRPWTRTRPVGQRPEQR